MRETEQRWFELTFYFGNLIPTGGMRQFLVLEESVKFPSHINLVSERSPRYNPPRF